METSYIMALLCDQISRFSPRFSSIFSPWFSLECFFVIVDKPARWKFPSASCLLGRPPTSRIRSARNMTWVSGRHVNKSYSTKKNKRLWELLFDSGKPSVHQKIARPKVSNISVVKTHVDSNIAAILKILLWLRVCWFILKSSRHHHSSTSSSVCSLSHGRDDFPRRTSLVAANSNAQFLQTVL